MANNSKADVFMLFGVEGGDDLTTGSGQLIAETLESIMKKVEATVTNHLTIKLSEQSLDTLREQIESTVTEALTSIKGTPVELTFSFEQKSVDKAFKEIKQQIKEQNITFTSQPQEKKPNQGGSGDIGSTSGSPSLENTKKEAEGVKQEIAGVEKAAEKVADAIESISEAERKAAEEAKKLQAIINKTIELDFPTVRLEREYKTTLGYLSDFISTRRTAKAKQDDYIVSTKDFTKFMNAKHADDYGWWAYKYEDPAEQREKAKEWITREYEGYDDLFDFIKNKDDEITGIRIKNQEELQKRIQEQHEVQRKIYDDQEKYNEAIRTACEQLGLSPNDSGWGYDINADQLRQLEQSVPGIQEALQIKAHGDITKTLEEAEKASQELKKIQDTFQAVEETATPALDSAEQEVNDIAEAEEKAIKGAEDLKYELSTFTESKFLEAPRKAAETANLLEHFPEDVSAFMGSDAQNLSNAEELLEKARQIREAREAAAKAAAEEAETIRQSSEASEDEIDDIHRRTDAIGDETDALRENSRAREEIEQELGDARRDGLDYERTVLSHSSTYAPNGVTHSVTTRGADTGSVYTDITKRIIGKDGSEQVLTTLKSTDAQINKTIENLSKKITILREQMGRIPEEYTSEIKAALDSTEQLVSAMSEAAAGEPDKMNGMNFTDIREAEAEAERSLRSINVQLGDAKKKVAEVRKEATSAEKAESRALDKIDETLARADAKRIQITRELASMTSEYATQFGYAGEQQEGINENISKLEQLKLSIEEYVGLLRKGEDTSDFWKDRIPGVTNLDSAVKELNKTLALTESELAVLKGDSTAVTDEAARVAVNQYNKAIKDFNSAQGHERFENLTGLSEIDASNLEEVRRNYSAITSATRELTTATSQLNAEYRDEQNNLTQRNKIFQEAKNYYDKYQSGIKANIELNQRWLKLMQQVHDGEINNEEARRALAELQTATKDANAETMTLWGSLKKLFTDHFGSVSATAAIGVFRNILRGAYQNVLDIDKAMTELRKVTDLAEVQYESFQKKAADMARTVGGTIADTINSVSSFARLGFNVDDSSDLAQAALVYKNVGDGLESIDEASESIISTIKAFSDINASDAMSIIDKFNEVGMRNSCPRHDSRKNVWLITISVKGWRQSRPRKDIMLENYY